MTCAEPSLMIAKEQMRGESKRQMLVGGIVFFLGMASAIALCGCDRHKSDQATNPASAARGNRPPPATKGDGKTVWVDPKTISEGPIQHESLTPEQLARIDKIHQTFAEVDSSTREKQIDGFKRDLHPDRELEMWEQMAKSYQRFVDARHLSLEAKKEVFKVVLMRSMASEEEALDHLKLNILSRDEAKAIMRGR
jgi:hypothetical protein